MQVRTAHHLLSQLTRRMSSLSVTARLYRRNSNMSSHPLQQAFQSSKPAFGAWITIPGPWAARTAAVASPHLSWLVIDCEHGLIPLQPGAAETIASVRGLGGNAPSMLIRIPATGACADGSAVWQIKYALDAGASGVIIPMVSARYLYLRP